MYDLLIGKIEMITFKQFLAEDSEVTLDDVIAAIKGYKHIPSEPIFRGVKKMKQVMVEKTPRTTQDGEGRKPRDSTVLLNNTFNAMMELVHGTGPMFRSNSFNVVGKFDIARTYGDVCFIFFDNDCDAYRSEEVSDTGFANIDAFASKHFDTSTIDKNIVAKIDKLDIYGDDYNSLHDKHRSKLTSTRIVEKILKQHTTLEKMREACKEEGIDPKSLDDFLKYLSTVDFSMSKHAVDDISKFSGTSHEMFIYGCSKYLAVNVSKVAGLIGKKTGKKHTESSALYYTEAQYAELYEELLAELK
jgi:hypothetical protein